MLLHKIHSIPLGYSEVVFNNKKYGITREEFNKGKSTKVYARQLGGNDFISLNYYITNKKESLKPCEMSEIKVIDFLNNFRAL